MRARTGQGFTTLQNHPSLQLRAPTSPARSRSPRSACASAIAPSTSTGDSSAMLADSARQRSSAASDARRSPRCQHCQLGSSLQGRLASTGGPLRVLEAERRIRNMAGCNCTCRFALVKQAAETQRRGSPMQLVHLQHV